MDFITLPAVLIKGCIKNKEKCLLALFVASFLMCPEFIYLYFLHIRAVSPWEGNVSCRSRGATGGSRSDSKASQHKYALSHGSNSRAHFIKQSTLHLRNNSYPPTWPSHPPVKPGEAGKPEPVVANQALIFVWEQLRFNISSLWQHSQTQWKA